MHHMWGKGKVIYVSPWMTILIVVIGITVLVLANHDMVFGWIGNAMPPSKSGLRGRWVGLLDVHDDQNPSPKKLDKKAAIRFNLKMTKYVMGWYGGKGELMIQGEKQPRVIYIIDFMPDSKSKNLNGPYDAGIVYDGKPDDISGGFKGVLQTPTLSFERHEPAGYEMKGVLQKGTDEDYRRLVQQIR